MRVGGKEEKMDVQDRGERKREKKEEEENE